MKPDYYRKTITSLLSLKDNHPAISLGHHLSTIIDEYTGNLWDVTDKNLFLSTQKYANNLSLDIPHNDDDIEEIIKGGMNLTSILDDPEDGY